MQLTIEKARGYILHELRGVYSESEIKSMFRIVLHSEFDISDTDILLNPDKEFSQSHASRYFDIVKDLVKEVPLQHILGETEFYGLNFKVNKNTLVPRPETEELVEWIISENIHNNTSILDIGTGTGCIPVSLKSNIEGSEVYAVDISDKALKVAEDNAKKNSVDVTFINADILTEKPFSEIKFDVIVSNPPYVMNKEKELMSKNVLDYDPHLALFVDDNNPLIFYDKIAEYASERLKKGGKLYLEINEALGEEICKCIKNYGFGDIVLRKDINGKDRMIRAIKNNYEL